MSIILDSQRLFDEQNVKIEAGSLSRDSIEKAIPGLDGVLSIDLGTRGRQIKQRGALRAKSLLEMDDRISLISSHMDGNTHKLVTSDGEEFDNLRMDVFKITRKQISGGGLCWDYEIIYKQLTV